MSDLISPTVVAVDHFVSSVQKQGYAVLSAADVCTMAQADLQPLVESWHDLPPDNYLKDGGRYRRRRHSSFIVENGRLRQVTHRPHWQPLSYNALHGGMVRLFEPIQPTVVATAAWQNLLQALAQYCSALKGEQTWYIEAHQFRIDTTDGIGRPTPEGAHRDGVDFVAVLLVERKGIKGGETRVFEANGSFGQRFTLTDAWSLLFLDDEKVIHESTPILPIEHDGGYRDTLVLTFRRGGFQQDFD
ncbi:2OG-Fe dioxygenase family protein [Hydromonas duriensis]|nr:2OG-Fe dioxygenase family protein [Hydromonas duriensis]